jgi:hypothetical protein
MITDTQARKIACEWHGGGGSALYALCSSGAIITDGYTTMMEIDDASRGPASPEDIDDLITLADYVMDNLGRGPVDGWSKLSW